MLRIWVRMFEAMTVWECLKLKTKKDRGHQHAGLLSRIAGMIRAGLLNTLLAQASAGGRALASLELGVALADNIERTLALHDLAISVATLHGGE